MSDNHVSQSGLEIAIIGMAGRFPGARNIAEFWDNLVNGRETISFFSDDELRNEGVDDVILRDPSYVKARGIVVDEDRFDASFFNIYPREAEIMNPQQRFFLQCSWEALEDAGYDPDRYQGLIGVFGGIGMDAYSLRYLIMKGGRIKPAEGYQFVIGNDKDFLTTRVSYKFNLKGPSVNVQSGCSTSLVAVHLACQSLINYESDMALAGGVTISIPQKTGYFYEEGMITSPDGHCRVFDAKAMGTVPGNGCGMVVLKRLKDALQDADHIYAVLKGSAINNDGSLKVGFTAPSVEGQADVIAAALAIANVPPESISYIEAHGTGTPLGDPIEIAALNRVYRSATDKKHFCGVGSVKTNVGHLDTAAGVTGLIKAALALHHRKIPPSLHFNQPNPQIDFKDSPFFVVTQLQQWHSRDGSPLRSGVSSFGIGGTNVHAILEEAPQVGRDIPRRRRHLLMLSGKSEKVVERAGQQLATYFEQNPDLHLADVSYTTQVGRKAFKNRQVVLCQSPQDAAEVLQAKDPKRLMAFSHPQEPANPGVVFMFSGQGAQYLNMAKDLYETEPNFADSIDQCSEILRSDLNLYLRDILYPGKEQQESATHELNQTYITQPALFVVEYALAKLWMKWGVHPQAMIGHSIGEYVAACLAGVFSLEQALKIVALRGRLMQSMPAGAMLSVPLDENRVRTLLMPELSLAAVNAPELCVVSGEESAIQELEKVLTDLTIETRRLHTSHAFHSKMMEPILKPFLEAIVQMQLAEPQLDYISNVTGTWIDAKQATDPTYYSAHLRQTVRFSDGVSELLRDPTRIFLEVGPGNTLSTLAKRQSGQTMGRITVSSMRHPHEIYSDDAFLLTTLGRLWLAGVEIDWAGFYHGEKRLRVPLPTYPFETQRYWLDYKMPTVSSAKSSDSAEKLPVAEWYSIPTFRRSHLPMTWSEFQTTADQNNWLVFADESPLSARLIELLTHTVKKYRIVTTGDHYEKSDAGHYVINPAAKEDYQVLLEALAQEEMTPHFILHLWSAATDSQNETAFDEAQNKGLKSVLYLTQALQRISPSEKMELCCVVSQIDDVTGQESLAPEKATLIGALKVIPQEFPQLACRLIDVLAEDAHAPDSDFLAKAILMQTASKDTHIRVALRGKHLWIQDFEPTVLRQETSPVGLRKEGVYLITGGLGRIGLAFAEFLAQHVQARLVLVDQISLPANEEWNAWLTRHGADDPVSRRILALQKIEKQGGQVLSLQADVIDERQWLETMEIVQKRWGALHGVIHAAGAVGENSVRPIAEIDDAVLAEQFRAKVLGLQAMHRTLHGQSVDFILLQSSLSTILGGLGLAAYAAANSYMDCYAAKFQGNNGVRWIAANWDGWRFDESPAPVIGKSLLDMAVTPQEGQKALQQIIESGYAGQLVISTTPLKVRLSKWVTREKDVPSETSVSTGTLHSRPQLQTLYVAPSNELEHQLVQKWQDVLGIEPIGIYDNFFDLGGNSLLGTQLLSQLRVSFRMDLPLRTLFEDPTVSGAAKYIAEQRAQKGTSDDADLTKIAEILSQINELSDDQAKEMLQKKE